MGRTAPRPVIDRIAPEAAGLGPAAAGVEHRQRGVVGKHLGRGQHRADHQIVERRQPPAGAAHPVAQRRAVERDALPRQHLRLPIQRQGIAELADHHVHDQRFGRHAAVDRPLRRRRHHHGTLASAAGVARAARDAHAQLRRHDVELLGAQFADAVHGAAAARARRRLGIDHHLIARQVRRQRAVVAGGAIGTRLGLPIAVGSAASCAAWFSAAVCSRSSRPSCNCSSVSCSERRPNWWRVRRCISSRSLSFSAYNSSCQHSAASAAARRGRPAGCQGRSARPR